MTALLGETALLYRMLAENEVVPALFAGFHRHQEVTRRRLPARVIRPIPVKFAAAAARFALSSGLIADAPNPILRLTAPGSAMELALSKRRACAAGARIDFFYGYADRGRHEGTAAADIFLMRFKRVRRTGERRDIRLRGAAPLALPAAVIL